MPEFAGPGDFWDEDGNPISLEEWGRKFEDFPGRTLAENMVSDAWLRTVWLGDQRWRLFGTALSKPGKAPKELQVYPSKEDALEGHRDWLAKLRLEATE